MHSLNSQSAKNAELLFCSGLMIPEIPPGVGP